MVKVDDGRMFRKSRPHFPQFSLRLVLLSAAILVEIVIMLVDILSCIAGKQDLSSKCTRSHASHPSPRGVGQLYHVAVEAECNDVSSERVCKSVDSLSFFLC